MEYINLLSQWGLIVVWALATYLWYQYFNQKINGQDIRNPLNHKFFWECDFYLTNKVPNIKLYNKEMKFEEVRTLIFKDMMMIKIRIRKKRVEDFAKSYNENILECSTKCINWLVEEYNKERNKEWIPSLVISKFNERHLWHATALMEAIEWVCGSRSFHNEQEKKNAILHLHTMMLVLTIIDAEKTLWILNWELKGIKYKWKIIF